LGVSIFNQSATYPEVGVVFIIMLGDEELFSKLRDQNLELRNNGVIDLTRGTGHVPGCSDRLETGHDI